MKKTITVLSLLFTISMCTAMNAQVKTIPQIATMFQQVRVSDLPGPKRDAYAPAKNAWERAMDAVRDKLASMQNVSLTDENGLMQFFKDINDFQDKIYYWVEGGISPFNEKTASTRTKVLNKLLSLQKKAERLAVKNSAPVGKKTFGQKVKSFFSKKTTAPTTSPTDEENVWELLRGALDLLKARVALLHKEDAALKKQGK